MSETSRSDAEDAALRERIQGKRKEIAAYLNTMEPRSRRLTNIAIVCGAITAALVTGPALGGESLTAMLTERLGLAQPIWQLLCLAAMVCSIAATIATNMSTSHETAARIARAQMCGAKLEGLEALLETGTVDVESASEQFAASLEDIPFV